MSEVIDVSQWTRIHSDKKHPFWWGILGLILIEATVVAGFLTAYFYLWIVNVAEDRMGWPPEGTPLPPLFYPTINCFLLLICAWTMWYGGRVMKKDRTLTFTVLVFICSLCSVLVLYLRWLQLAELPYDWKQNAYTSFVWFLTGFHFLHIASALVGTVVIGGFAYKGYYSTQGKIGIQVDTMYWYFVVAVWFPIYFALYWAPRWIS